MSSSRTETSSSEGPVLTAGSCWADAATVGNSTLKHTATAADARRSRLALPDGMSLSDQRHLSS